MRALIQKEIRDALRNRWLVGYAVLLGVLGLAAAMMGVQAAGSSAFLAFGRTTASLMNLCILLAPLAALSLGTLAVAGERDRGTLELLLAQPLGHGRLLLGKYTGLLLALLAATAAGFLPAGIVVALYATPAELARYLLFPALAALLIAAMLGLGLLLSVRSRGAAAAQGLAVLAWFAFVLLYDLLLLGVVSLSGIGVEALTVLLLANPVDAARVLVVLALEPDLHLLGPAGAFLVGRLTVPGTAAVLLGALLLWAVLPLLAALRAFRVRPDRKAVPAAASVPVSDSAPGGAHAVPCNTP